MPVKISVDKFNCCNQLAVFGILGQVDGCTNSQRKHHDHRQKDDVQGVQNIRQDADGVIAVAALGAQKLPADAACAAVKDIANQKDQQRTGNTRTQVH